MWSSVVIGFGYKIREKLVISQGPEKQKIRQTKVSLAHQSNSTYNGTTCTKIHSLLLNKHIFFSQRIGNISKLNFSLCQQVRDNVHHADQADHIN